MSDSRRKEELATKAMLAVGKMAGKELDDFALEIYVTSICDLPEHGFDKALAYLRQAFKERKLPSVAEIENFAVGQLPGEDLAVEISEAIAGAISRFGKMRQEAAKAHLGEASWLVVERCGGWGQICDIPDHKTLSVEKARFRDMARVVLKRALGGTQNDKPCLPAPIVPTTRSTNGRQIGDGGGNHADD